MLTSTPSPFSRIVLDGEVCCVMAWSHIYKRKNFERNKQACFRFKTEWKAYRGYSQHATIDVNIHKVGLLVASGIHKEHILELLLNRYNERKILGHGVKPFNPFNGGKG